MTILTEIRPAFSRVAMLAVALAFEGWSISALAHPGSGIVVDSYGRVYFTVTGQGVWKIDESGRVSPHEEPAFHWLAIDRDDRFAGSRSPTFLEPSTQIQKVGGNPTLLLASDFPVTTDRESALDYPEFGEDKRLRIHRLLPSGERAVVATLPAAADGTRLAWLNGIAAGPDGAISCSENAAVRRISPQDDRERYRGRRLRAHSGHERIIAAIERIGANESRAVQVQGATSKTSFVEGISTYLNTPLSRQDAEACENYLSGFHASRQP